MVKFNVYYFFVGNVGVNLIKKRAFVSLNSFFVIFEKTRNHTNGKETKIPLNLIDEFICVSSYRQDVVDAI